MKTAIVNISEITDKEKNPTLCLSAKRYTGHCASCQIFRYKLKKLKSLDETIKSMKCKPIIDKEQLLLLKKQEILKKQLNETNKKIKDIDNEIDIT